MFDNNQPLVMKANVNTIQHPHLMDPDRSIEGDKTQVSRRQARLVWQKATDLANKIEAEGIERDGIYEAAIAVGYTPEEAELVVQNVASDANWEFIKHETGVISVRSDDKCTRWSIIPSIPILDTSADQHRAGIVTPCKISMIL